MTARAIVFAGALFGMIAGCSCSDPLGRSCRSSSECDRGQVCTAGHCRPSGLDAGPPPDGSVPPGDGGGADTGTCATSEGEVASLPVDIIIIVDQSASTGEENAAISTNLTTNLVNILEASGLDYHVILINTDPRICPEPPLGLGPTNCLGSNLPRYHRILHPVNNSDELTLLLWTYNGEGKRPNSCVRVPDPTLSWRGDLRPEAQKIFVVFSDDDPGTYSRTGGLPGCHGGGGFAGCSSAACPTLDCPSVDWGSVCPNFGCPTFADRPADWAGGADFPTELYRLDPPGMFGTAAEPRWIFHSLIGISSQREASEPEAARCDICDFGGNTAEASGTEYQRLSIMSGGLRFPSCNTDYSPVFQRIAETIIPLACEFVVTPTTAGGTIDPTRTNVVYTPGDGSGDQTILQDMTRTCGVDANGWQWNADFSRIRLCGPACDAVQADPDGRVRITVGCTTEIRPPF